VAQRILVVDDDVAARELLPEILRRKNYQVTAVEDGKQALEACAHRPPDLILLDVIMGGIDGFEVCRRIKSNPRTRLVPVVLVTALSDTEERIRGLDAGADDLLSKPYDHLELLARVRSLLHTKAYTDELEHAAAVLFALARTIEAKDPYTHGHCERLAKYATELGRRIGLGNEEVSALGIAGMVHDIGKVAVPESILLKKATLTAEEWKIVKQHPAAGEQICKPLKSMHLVLPIIRHHHENLNGSGYPDALRGERISLTARVMRIVDVYDALTTERPYKPAWSKDESLAVMANGVKKGNLDADLFTEFQHIAPVTESSAA